MSKITIEYGFYTDGDYSLKSLENFGCTGREVEIDDRYFDYVGEIEFESEDSWKCKRDAKDFLSKLLCDGIHISYTHHYLMKYFYELIDSLIDFVNNNTQGGAHRRLTGNYDNSYIFLHMYDC